MRERTPVKRTPVIREKESTNKADVQKKQPTNKPDTTGKLRPPKTEDKRITHGVWSLDRLLREDLDGRLRIVKHRDQLESDLIAYIGEDNLTPPLLSLVKRVIHKEIVLQHAEKMSLLGRFNLADKSYTCLANSLRLDLQALESMLRQRKPKALKTLDQYLYETYRRDDK
jgi:hypothetical protein